MSNAPLIAKRPMVFWPCNNAQASRFRCLLKDAGLDYKDLGNKIEVASVSLAQWNQFMDELIEFEDSQS
jgi:hypothetical protein